MTNPLIQVADHVEDALAKLIGDGLNSFNDRVTGYADRKPLAVWVADPVTGLPAGGATGRTSLGLLFLEMFYLPKELRGGGIGTEILRRFEAEGRQRGCRSAVVMTISFQAPAFYERNGWTRFGEVPCDPPGTSRVFLAKAL